MGLTDEQAARQLDQAAEHIEAAIVILQGEHLSVLYDKTSLESGEVELSYLHSTASSLAGAVRRVAAELERAEHYVWMAGGRC